VAEPEEIKRLALSVGGSLLALEDGHRYAVGRSASCEVRVNHATVSERHCLLVCENDRVTVQDLGSHNGTQVEGDTVTGTQDLVVGQTLRVGAIEMKLLIALDMPATPPLTPIVDPRLRFRETSFADLMAEELRRAPWFTLSAIIHALIFLILYHVMEQPPETGERNLTIEMLPEAQDPALEQPDSPPEAEIREEEEVLEEIAYEDPFEVIDEPELDLREAEFDLAQTGMAGTTHWLENVKNKDGGGVLGNAAVRAGGFGKTVSNIRRSGLEIVFVFDSTGSMGSILQGTKERIAHMFEVLHALVPDARIGLVTYRDRDGSEEYLTRSVPLSGDIYRAINFMQVIDAGGGGNRPEAVLDGLKEAFQQRWHPKARRVVVLIGDAPAHRFDERKIKSLVKGFSGNGRSFVHSIVTSPYGSDNLEPDTKRSFGDIASAGRGECIGFENESKVLQQVLSLAFGREFRKNLDEASRILDRQKSNVSTFALDLVRREDLVALEDHLRKNPVSDDIVKALARSSSKEIAKFLVTMLKKRDLGQPGRQAATYALGRVMNGRLGDALDRLLVQATDEGSDARRKPWELGPLPPRAAARLIRLIERA